MGQSGYLILKCHSYHRNPRLPSECREFTLAIYCTRSGGMHVNQALSYCLHCIVSVQFEIQIVHNAPKELKYIHTEIEVHTYSIVITLHACGLWNMPP